MDYGLHILSKSPPLYPEPSRFSPVLSSRNSIVLCFTCRSMIHFQVIFVNSIGSGLDSSFCMWIFNCSSTIYWLTKFYWQKTVCALNILISFLALKYFLRIFFVLISKILHLGFSVWQRYKTTIVKDWKKTLENSKFSNSTVISVKSL